MIDWHCRRTRGSDTEQSASRRLTGAFTNTDLQVPGRRAMVLDLGRWTAVMAFINFDSERSADGSTGEVQHPELALQVGVFGSWEAAYPTGSG